jgi:hypothetical protein
MITIHRYFPFNGLAHVKWEFHPDRVVIATRSLTYDNRREIRYRKIARIQRFRYVDFGWINRACTLVMWAGLGLLVYQLLDVHIPTFWLVEKVIVIAAFFMALPGFRKHEYVAFLGQNAETLATLQLQRRSFDQEESALGLINKKNRIKEDSFADPLPKRKPVYKIEELTPLKYWHRYHVLFYEDRIIEQNQSFIQDSTMINRYGSLSGKVTTAWMGDDSWSYVWCYWLYLVATVGYVFVLFYPQFLYQNWTFIYTWLAAFALLIPLYLMKFWKREHWILLTREGGQAIRIRMNASNRENLRKIERYVTNKARVKRRKPA